MTGCEAFDEGYYLQTNPDVADAVRSGHCASGLEHFLRHGKREGRVGTPGGKVMPGVSSNAAGREFAASQGWPVSGVAVGAADPSNPLRDWFNARQVGAGIWKWDHYFDAYHRHFGRFRGQDVHVLEIGIYSGGSLELWRDYFGPKAHIYGVDIEPACKAYAADSVTVFVGDQADRVFWGDVRRQVPALDIVIDDGGHQPVQRVVSLEELLPHLRPGGVYVCEDVRGEHNPFASYAQGMADTLNSMADRVENLADHDRRLVCRATPFQTAVAAVHFYPFLVAVEKTAQPVGEFIAPKHGTEWQPFLR
jgi:predicted O-methyltransferase YrrM